MNAPSGAVGVVGAGFMGSGIAESAARAGFDVVIYEPEQAPLDHGRLLWGGLAVCFGGETVTLGSWLAVCEAAVPLRPHSNAVDRIATAEGATRLDDILITRSPKSGQK